MEVSARIVHPLTRRVRSIALAVRHQYETLRGRRRLSGSHDTGGSIGKDSLFTLLANPEPTILDVGAHVGLDSIEFSLMFPRGRIICFEADSNNFRDLANATRHFSNITAVQAAVCNSSGVVSFNGSSGKSDASGSILTPTKHLERHPGVIFSSSLRQVVPSITLDEFVDESRIAQVDLLWIDVQGAELLVLKGATSLLPRIRYIYAEVSMEPLYAGGATYRDLRGFVANYGFKVLREFLPSDWSGEGNVLFGRQN